MAAFYAGRVVHFKTSPSFVQAADGAAAGRGSVTTRAEG